MAGFLLAQRPTLFGAQIINPFTLTLFTFDATVSEDHEVMIEWTEFPVESGLGISDHYIEKAETLSLAGVVTDSPLLGIPEQGRANRLYERLLTLARSGTLFTVSTGFRVYQDMGIESVRLSRTRDTGQGAFPVVSLRKVRIVNSVTVPVPTEILSPPRKPSHGTEADAGIQAGAEAAATTAEAGSSGPLDKASALKQLSDIAAANF